MAAAVVATSSFTHPGRAATIPADASSTPAASSISLSGEGASDPSAELTTWQNDLYGNSGTLNLKYAALGGYKARQDLLSGSIDYAISGVPFTPAELATLPSGSGSFIDAPVMASALGVLTTPPADDQGTHGWGLQSIDQDGNSTYQPYTGPLKVPMPNLAAMVLKDSVTIGNGVKLNAWSNPAIIAAFGLKTQVSDGTDDDIIFEPSSATPSNSVLRSDPSESDYYSLLLAETAAPQVWSDLQKYDGATFQVADTLPPTLTQPDTRQGLGSQLSKMFPNAGPNGQITLPPVGDGTDGSGGTVAPVQPSALTILQGSNPAQAALLQWISTQNANGDWLTPSPTSIDAAINAGGDTPFYGLTHAVAGAYPLTYVDHLYAPAHGLSVDKTEALATTIRYLATDGQTPMTANNDGVLSASLKAQALAAANQLVLSNCTGTGAQLVVSADPGRFAPDLPGMKAIGSMLHCDAPAAAAATTSTPAAATSSPSLGGVISSTGDSFAPATSTSAPSAGTEPVSGSSASTASPPTASSKPATAGKPPSSLPTAVNISGLPISLPFSTGGSFDRYTALFLGAACFFLGRRVVSWLIGLTQR